MRVICVIGVLAIAVPVRAASYSPSEPELLMLRRLVEDDVEGWRLSGDVALRYPEWPPVVRAEKLVDAYAENEVAADISYKGKRILLSMTVDAIRKDAADKPFLSLTSGSGTKLRSLQARFPESSLAELALLKKKQQVTVACIVRGLALGQPVLNDCALFDATEVTDAFMKTFGGALRGERELEAQVAMVVVYGIALARLWKADSDCLTKSLKSPVCDAEIGRLMKKSGVFETAMKTVREELVKAGLKWAAVPLTKEEVAKAGSDAGTK